MEWKWPDGTKVRGKKRVIKITEPSIIELTRQQLKRYPSGPIFRNNRNRPWLKQSLKHNFRRLRQRLKKAGVHLDQDACTYSCRHTFAKRVLNGYWTGKPSNIETLAQLMGISRQVCWEYYAQWCASNQEPLWEAVG
jgi:integrase